jgi:PAS domain-containing protein
MAGGLLPRAVRRPPPVGEAADAGLGLRLESMTAEAFAATLRQQQAICVLVSAKNELLQVIGDPALFLRVPEGKAPLDVTKMVPKPLALALNTALHRARTQNVPVSYSGVKVEQRDVDLLVTHHAGGKASPEFFMVLLKPAAAVVAVPRAPVEYDVDSQVVQRIADLELDLQQTRENLQATIEELETTNEEQQATNQEMLASNEELQSTNEELQSVNEELYSVNAEFQSKIGELSALNNDMDNLLRSTDIGTVFLDRELRIRKFTPAVTSVIKLLDHDIGRSIDQIAYSIDMTHDDLLALIEQVLETGEHAECNVTSRTATSLLTRVHPYRDEAGRTDGVVLTFVDVSDLKRAELQSRLLQTMMQVISAATDFEAAMGTTLTNICETNGWDYAETWIPRGEQEVLVCCSTYAASKEMEPFRRARSQLALSTDACLLGRAWSSKQPQWTLDLSSESEEVVCADVAAKVGLTASLSVPIVIPAKGGLKSAFGLPLRAHDEVEVILTFFMCKRPHEQDLQSVTNLLSPLASELGAVIHRKRTDTTLSKAYEELRQKNAELEQFAHTVSHDLKSPLVTIGGMLGIERSPGGYRRDPRHSRENRAADERFDR